MASAPDSKYGPPCATGNRTMVKADLGASGVFFVPWDRRAVVPLMRAVARIKAHNIEHPESVYKVRTGEFQTYNCRHMLNDDSKPWSFHAWPLAIDINPKTNPFGHSGDLPAYFVECFKAEGFGWLGPTFDPMHEELVRFDGRTRFSLADVDHRQFLSNPPNDHVYPGHVLAPGADEPAVRRFKQRLANLGYRKRFPFDMETHYGPTFERAVREFQKDRKLRVDSRIGRDTWEAAF